MQPSLKLICLNYLNSVGSNRFNFMKIGDDFTNILRNSFDIVLSKKHKKSFALLGTAIVKVARKTLVKLILGVRQIDILRAHILYKSLLKAKF